MNVMSRNVLAIIAIFLCTSAAWMILGSSIVVRTESADSDLGPRVASTWGAPQQQTAPVMFTSHVVQKQNTNTVQQTITTALPIERSRIDVALNLEQRQKGLLWFPTYRVDFKGVYLFRNISPVDDVILKFALPVADAIYDDLVIRADGESTTSFWRRPSSPSISCWPIWSTTSPSTQRSSSVPRSPFFSW